MLRHALLALSLILTAGLAPAAEPSGRLKVLFLGDRGHHVPAERAAQLVPALAARGIDVEYTERVDDLNPENLKTYDAVIVYANIDAIAPGPLKALLDYVEAGGGFVPIHCASFCFRNAPEYVALVGAQFQRHNTGTFDTKVVAPDQPIVRGLEPFRTWDETYVHTMHNPKDRVVLQVRAEGDREEPWTWVRTQGKGRVFYTAYGHDNRTWGHPGFVDLVERGIRWAANKGDVYDSRTRAATGLKPFEYEEAGAEIPNYLPSQRWGTQGEPIRTMQKPLDAAESIKHLAVPRGFTPKLFAAEPAIARPICMTFDHLGRLWIAESIDYPNTKHPGVGRDRIKVLEDTDGDGHMDKSTVFAEGLNIPTSLLCYNGGVIVLQAPDTLFLKDTDGDGKADVKEVLFTGWGTTDTHAGPSNLRWGFDNWVYGIVGYSAFDGTVGGEHHRFGQGFYRFKPDGSRLEFLRSTNNNSWGVGFSEEGLLFGSTANGCPSVYVPIPNRYYEKLRGGSAAVLANIADTNRFFPITDKVRQVDWHGGFTAGAGHALYTARAYPSYYWNRTAFVAEPTGHLVATFALQKKGTDFASHNSWNLVASDDEWTAPIAAEVGPDGHVWVIDWYNYIVQHNPTPRGFKTGHGNAYETPLRDQVHGRIYRIVYGDAKPATIARLDPADAKGLVAALTNDNMFWRLHAQRLLVERGKADVVPDLVKLVRGRAIDAIGLDPGAIHALWTLHGLGALDKGDGREAAIAALKHPSSGVRRNAALALPRDDDAAARVVAAGLLKDEEPLVRLAALETIADAPPSDASAKALADALRDGLADGDRWLPDALTVAAATNDAGFLEALAESKGGKPLGGKALSIVGRVAEHYARGAPGESVGVLIAVLGEGDPKVAEAVVAGLFRGWPKGKKATLDDKAEAALGRLLGRLPSESKGPLIGLASRLGSTRLEAFAAETAAGLLKTAEDDAKPEADRIAAAGQLAELLGNEETARSLLALITPRTPPSLGVGLVEAVAKGHDEAIAAALLEALPAMTPTVRAAALRALLGRADWTPALVKAIEGGTVRLDALSLDQKQALADHPNRALAGRARRLLARGGGLPDPDRQKVIDELAPVVLKGGDAAKGKLVFEQQCAKCHTHSGAGGKVGPDLTGMAAHPREELLVHILDPSRSVEGNFVQYTAATTAGRVLNGLLASETKTAVELLDAEGKTHVLPRSDIDELVASKKSIMPEGFEKQVPRESLADLLAFLTARGKYLPLDLRKAATVVSTKGMFTDENADVERLVFADWSQKVVDGVPFQLVDPRGDRVPNAIELQGPEGPITRRMPRAVSLPCNAPARAIHILGGIGGWAFPYGEKGTVSMIVRLHYADGKTEDHPLKNGVEIADYIRVVDVPGSKLAFRLRGQQIRSLSIQPGRTTPIESVEFVKGPDEVVPVVMAVTVEVAD